MGIKERNTDIGCTGGNGKPEGSRHDFLSALENGSGCKKSTISKELRRLSMLVRNVKREAGDMEVPGKQDKTEPAPETTPADGRHKSDFSKIEDFIAAEGDNRDLTIDDIIRSGAPSGDYFSFTDSEVVVETVDSGDSSQIGSIDSFLEAVKNGEFKNACLAAENETVGQEVDDASCGSEDEPCPIDEEFYTESLAKIYIQQRRYDRALEIINKLSLIYPEKNIYFADQIRFLKKLIDNIKK